MKKIITVLLLLLLVVPASYVSADVNWDWAWVFSHNQKNTIWGFENYRMRTDVGIDTYDPDNKVYLQTPSGNNILLNYIDDGVAPYEYYRELAPPKFLLPGSVYEVNYTFYVSDTGPIINPTNNFINIEVPQGSIKKIPFMEATISGGVHPTVTWDPVDGAEEYRFRLINPINGEFLFEYSMNNSINSYTYDGNLFSQYNNLEIFMEVRDYLDGTSQLLNRSRVIYAHTVPEPATMFLLGLGLVGLAGVGKRFIK